MRCSRAHAVAADAHRGARGLDLREGLVGGARLARGDDHRAGHEGAAAAAEGAVDEHRAARAHVAEHRVDERVEVAVAR